MAIYGGQVRTTPYQAPDYGPSVAAAKELAMTQAQGIAGMVGQVGDYFKKQKESKNLATMGLKIAEAAKIMDPAQAPYYDNIINTLKDENTPVDVRGALGAQVQDLLKQNTSMRAVAVQERQMGMVPSYAGGSEYMQNRIGAASRMGIPRQGPASSTGTGDTIVPLDSESNEPIVPFAPPGASINLDANTFNENLSKLGRLKNISPDENARRVRLFAEALAMQNQEGASQMNSALSREIADAAKLYEKPTNASLDEVQTPSGTYEAYKTSGGDYVTGNGVIIDPNTGKPKQFNPIRPLTSEEIQKAEQDLYGQDGPGVLPRLETPPPAGTVPVETGSRSPVSGIPTFEDLTAMAQPQGGELYPIGSDTQPPAEQPATQSAQSRVIEGTPAQSLSSLERQKATSAPTQAQPTKDDLVKEYKNLTTLDQYQQNVVNDVLVEASQAGPSPNKQVTEEIKRNILLNRAFVPTGLPTEGVRIVSKEQKAKNNKALLSQAQGRVVDRSMAYEVMKRFETVQQILNNPKAGELFGQSIPEEEIKKLSREQGSIYALYENLKGQDLVSALRNIKEQSGTAAGMAAAETKALQDAVNSLNTKQDWNAAKKTLMQIAAESIRTGKRMGLTGVFSYVDPNDKSKGFKSSTLLNSTNEFDPIFEDEVDYFKKLEKIQSKLQGASPVQPVQLSQPQQNPYDQALQNINSSFFGK
jgi:hypothetical protein